MNHDNHEQNQYHQENCLRCGHEWMTRVARPVQCPSCKSPYWHKLRVRAARKRGNDA
jgi:predicted Zn-ribbon and HTH transcriptional regulator